MVGILHFEEGSLQLGEGNHRLVEGSPLLLEGNHLLQEGSHQLGVGSRLPEGGSRLLQEGSLLRLVGSRLLLVGSRLLGVDMHLVERGNPLAVVGIHLTEEGILGSSSSETREDMKLWLVIVIIWLSMIAKTSTINLGLTEYKNKKITLTKLVMVLSNSLRDIVLGVMGELQQLTLGQQLLLNVSYMGGAPLFVEM